MSRRRAAFTLAEILISIGIFITVAAVMLGVLFTATSVFRDGEAARQAGDEATAVVTALQDDLDRMVPVKLRNGTPAPEWGRMLIALGSDGNTAVTFRAYNPDRASVAADGTGSRVEITWAVEPAADGDHGGDRLVRTVKPLDAAGAVVAGISYPTTVTTGCLHFAAVADLPQIHRTVTIAPGDTSPRIDWDGPCRPDSSAPILDTHAGITLGGLSGVTTFYPRPAALRITLVLTGGGRYAQRGTLVHDIDAAATAIPIAGLKALPTQPGSMLRIENEWFAYDAFRDGQAILSSAAQRGARRTAAAAHAPAPGQHLRLPVWVGAATSLVVPIRR